MNLWVVIGTLALSLVGGWSWTLSTVTHQDPSHRLHACSADHNTNVCGELGGCEHCVDNSRPYIGRGVC